MLNYNENKVKAGVASCIHENLYGLPVLKMVFADKLKGLTNYTDRNRRAVSNAVHISLNFHPDEKIDIQRAKAITDTYMEKIGFGNQPYLVYQHEDAAHPHVHIVTTNIKANGDRIIMYNIGRNQSEKARQEIEKDFGLITASGRRQANQGVNRLIEVETRAVYGKTETRRTIANAITRALWYKFTSLPEFNAILRQYNVVADTGKDGSFIHSKKGLVFFNLDLHGNKVGVPIKASSFHNRPTVANLEKLFRKNEALRMVHRDHVKKCIENALSEPSQKGAGRGDGRKTYTRKFIQALNRERIFVLFRKNTDGVIYGITFVDNRNKVVFNGSDLGKAYGAKALTERLTDPVPVEPHLKQRALESDFEEMSEVITDLTTAQQYDSAYNPHLRKIKRKKRKLSP